MDQSSRSSEHTLRVKLPISPQSVDVGADAVLEEVELDEE